MLAAVLYAYGLRDTDCTVTLFGSGLINHTWLVQCGHTRFILQRINTKVFQQPRAIAQNLEAIGSYLARTAPQYLFVQPLKTTGGEPLLHHAEGVFRLLPFVEGSHTIDVVTNPQAAYEAARQFGRFTKMLRGFEAGQLQTTLPYFHNLALRFQQFTAALETASDLRKTKAHAVCQYLLQQQPIVATYESHMHNPAFVQRVTHHDTKISNVLFNEAGAGLCVIDLDTVMPGYFISDVGDMMRTYLSPVSEEEADLEKIAVRDAFFMAIVNGYRSEMDSELTPTEKANFVYAGVFMIYMQALRFATDYLQNDVYYGQKYEGHNLLRATNQATLLQRLLAKEASLQQQVAALQQPALPV